MPSFSQSQMNTLTNYINSANQDMTDGNPTAALNEIQQYCSAQTSVRGYATDALNVINDQGLFGETANQDVEQVSPGHYKASMFDFMFRLILMFVSFSVCAYAGSAGMSHIWLYPNCSKLTFGIQDQLDNPDVHTVKYVVLFGKKPNEKYVVERKYQIHNTNQVTYPDDFHFPKAPELAPELFLPQICNRQVEWRIYVDGVLRVSGVAGTQIRRFNKNGVMTAPKRPVF